MIARSSGAATQALERFDALFYDGALVNLSVRYWAPVCRRPDGSVPRRDLRGEHIRCLT